jgi:hypothetical protein
MPKRLYVVSVETEMVVLAESPQEAKEIAGTEQLEWSVDDASFSALPMMHMPVGWEADNIPFGEGDADDPDLSIEAWIERGAAPEYKQLRERIQEVQKKSREEIDKGG